MDRKDVDSFLLLQQLGTIASDLRGTLYRAPVQAAVWHPELSLSLSGTGKQLDFGETLQQERTQLPALEKRTPSPMRETAQVASILFTGAEASVLAPCFSPLDSLNALFPDRKRRSATDQKPFKVRKITEICTSESQNVLKVRMKCSYLTLTEQKMIAELQATGRTQMDQLFFTLENREREVDAQSHVFCESCQSRLVVQSVRGHLVTKAHRGNSTNNGWT